MTWRMFIEGACRLGRPPLDGVKKLSLKRRRGLGHRSLGRLVRKNKIAAATAECLYLHPLVVLQAGVVNRMEGSDWIRNGSL